MQVSAEPKLKQETELTSKGCPLKSKSAETKANPIEQSKNNS